MHPLRKWREAQSPKISQEALAAMVGSRQSSICRIEKGRENPTLDLAARIFEHTGVQLGMLANATAKEARSIARLTLGVAA